ncbi:MAG: peptidoglycan DD-metalloendopeptidase family protein [Candidatus Paracaedibacteraceae bacterium]|nr:peptidoglycan DD-metalloendopeptidase family protein [Candidatus Paracaedibacteraceae bacterium]
MAQFNKTNFVGISTIALASSIAVHSYITDSTTNVLIEQSGTVLSVPEKQIDQVISTGDINSAIAMPVVAKIAQDAEKTITISKNETLLTALTNLGFDRKHATHAINELKKVYNPRAIKQGQTITVQFITADDVHPARLKAMNFKTSGGNSIELTYENEQFLAKKFELKLVKSLRKVEGTINSSFYSAALKRGVPASIVKEAISALSYDINWQHDPKSGDEFKVLFEVFEDENGNVIRTGELKYAAFAPQGTWKRIYAFKTNGGTGFYNDRGESVVKSLLATPIDPTRMRITSKFGRRNHPILGYSKMHTGVDFGAPTGTPVSSAGDGVVVKACWNGAYGNYVEVRHNNQYSTAYAHLSKISVKPGQKIRQRQNIGSVGTTGRSTGPHLHYEVISHGKKINPLSVKQLPAVRLNKKELNLFQDVKLKCDKEFTTATPALVVAKKPEVISIG